MKIFNKQIAHRESFWKRHDSRGLIDSPFPVYSLPVCEVAFFVRTQKTADRRERSTTNH